jgi:hypothetical protein
VGFAVSWAVGQRFIPKLNLSRIQIQPQGPDNRPSGVFNNQSGDSNATEKAFKPPQRPRIARARIVPE